VVPISRYIAYFSVAVGGCVVDLVTKHYMFQWLGLSTRADADDHIWHCGNLFFGFQTTLNEGALFGMGEGFWAVFAVLSILAAIAIFVWLFVLGAAKDWWLTAALSLITAGIFGNLYDRLGLPGLPWYAGNPRHQAGTTVHAVRDFILMGFGNWNWPNYNIADSMLVVGAILLMCHAFLTQRSETPELLPKTDTEIRD
jgi:signal peptidase II